MINVIMKIREVDVRIGIWEFSGDWVYYNVEKMFILDRGVKCI